MIFNYWISSRELSPRAVVMNLICPTLWLMVSLDHLAITLGLSWLAIGVVYLAWMTGGFRRQSPELSFDGA